MDTGIIALDMVELNVELLAQQYEEQSQIAKMAEAQKRIIKKQLGQIMDLQKQDNLSTCEWKILRQEESGGTRLMKKDDLQEKFGKTWIEENSIEGKPITKFYIRKKKSGE